MTALPRWLTRASRVANLIYDRHLGWLLGHRILRLTHVGRRSGRRYRTVLEVVGRDRCGSEFFVVSGFGPRADWLRNLDAGGRATVTVGTRSFPADHRRLGDARPTPYSSTTNGATAGSGRWSIEPCPGCSAGPTAAAEPIAVGWSSNYP